MVTYGGVESAGNASSEAWELSLAGTPAWTLIETANGIWLDSQLQTAIYDPLGDRMIVCGGALSQFGSPYPGGVFMQLIFGGTPQWAGILGADPPYGTIASASVYDLTRERFVMFGGTNSTLFPYPGGFRETWAVPLDTPAWTQLATAGEAPWAPSGHTAIYDPIGDRMIVFGGWDAIHRSHQTHALAWTQTVSVPHGPSAAARFDAPRPNPALGTVRFTFALAKAGHATLDILDLQGRRVRRLAGGWLEAGAQTRAWDGGDEAGRATPAGVYFARFECAGARVTKRIVRLR
jgi:hypothetical protein